MDNRKPLQRRALLKLAGMTTLASTSGSFAALGHATATPAASRKKVVVTIFQRFGMDGLLAVCPYTDQRLAALRPNLMLSHPGSGHADARLELGSGFGLHPAFAPLAPFYRDGRLAIVHGVGSPDNTRSHSEAQRWWESGAPGDRSQRDGWLNRSLAALAPSGQALPAVALTHERPRIFYGDQPVTVADDLAGLSLPADAGFRARLRRLYEAHEHPALASAARQALTLSSVLTDEAKPETAYPEGSALGASLRDIAQLIRADLGLQLAFTESRESPNGRGTWDTHSNAAKTDANGPFPQMAGDLAASLAAFMEDLGPHQDDVIVVTLTDFGRNVVENERQGADHGRATAMFVLGGSVRGGHVYGTLPERFERDALEDAMDLPVTTDYRSVLAPVLEQHLGLASLEQVFPGWRGQAVALL